MKTFASIFLVITMAFIGCANTAYQKHQARLQELDSLYKSGQMDAVQYQVKYSAEVEDYNAKRMMGSGLIHHVKYRE